MWYNVIDLICPSFQHIRHGGEHARILQQENAEHSTHSLHTSKLFLDARIRGSYQLKMDSYISARTSAERTLDHAKAAAALRPQLNPL